MSYSLSFHKLCRPFASDPLPCTPPPSPPHTPHNTPIAHTHPTPPLSPTHPQRCRSTNTMDTINTHYVTLLKSQEPIRSDVSLRSLRSLWSECDALMAGWTSILVGISNSALRVLWRGGGGGIYWEHKYVFLEKCRRGCLTRCH